MTDAKWYLLIGLIVILVGIFSVMVQINQLKKQERKAGLELALITKEERLLIEQWRRQKIENKK